MFCTFVHNNAQTTGRHLPAARLPNVQDRTNVLETCGVAKRAEATINGAKSCTTTSMRCAGGVGSLSARHCRSWPDCTKLGTSAMFSADGEIQIRNRTQELDAGSWSPFARQYSNSVRCDLRFLGLFTRGGICRISWSLTACLGLTLSLALVTGVNLGRSKVRCSPNLWH